MGQRKNNLEDLEIQVARELHTRRKKRKRYPAGGQTRVAKDVRKGVRKPPPVPKNKSISEIQEMDPHDPKFRHPQGRPRKWIAVDDTPVVDESEMTWKDHIRRADQKDRNERRARVRKWEAEVVVAGDTLSNGGKKDGSKRDQQREKDIYDEDEAIAEGILSMDEWDDEELIRGYRRGRRGKFGVAPKFIPREVQQEAFRRLVNRGERTMRDGYLTAVQKLIDLAHNASSEKVQLDAVRTLMERVVGKVPDRTIISAEAEWQDMLMDSVVPVSDVPVLDFEKREDGVMALPPVVDDGPDLGPVDAPPDDRREAAPVIPPRPGVAAPGPSSSSEPPAPRRQGRPRKKKETQ